MTRTTATLLLLSAATLHAQSSPNQKFEVAAIKPTSPDRWNGPSGGTAGKGRYNMSNRTLKTYIERAYYIGPNQVIGGPKWLDEDRFDIDAKADGPTNTDEELMVMLRALLADRFQLAFHRVTRPVESYALEVAKNGPKLTNASEPLSSATTNSGHGSIDARAISMTRFTEVLSRQMDLPVVDATGIEGTFDVKLTWSRDADRPLKLGEPPKPDTGPSIFTAIQELGLRLQARKIPVEAIVIDHAEMPSPN